MANYGKDTIGASNEGVGANFKRFCKFTSPADISNVDSISAYLNRTAPGGGYQIYGAIYTDNAGVPNALVANSDIEINSNIARNSPNWYTGTYGTKPTLSPNTPYWLGVLSVKDSFIYFDTGASNQEANGGDTYPFNDPFGSSTYHAHELSVYVSYTGGQALVKIINETVGLSESENRLKNMARIISEVVGVVEVIVKTLLTSLVKVVSDTIGITESISRVKGIVKVISDTIGVIEAVLRRSTLTRIINETIGIAETILNPRKLIRLINETIGVIEARNYLRSMVRVISDTLGVSETIVKKLFAPPIIKVINETIGIVENVKFWFDRILKIYSKVTISQDLNITTSIKTMYNIIRAIKKALKIKSIIKEK